MAVNDEPGQLTEPEAERYPCTICGWKQQHPRMACARCQQHLDRTLADILELYALAEGELVPGSGSGRRGSGRSIGVRIAALDFLAGNDVVAALYQWERDWREMWALSVSDDVDSRSTRPRGWRAQATLSSTVRFLRAWLPKACDEHPAIDEFAKEVRDLHAVALSAARVNVDGGTVVKCPTETDELDDEGTPVKCGTRLTIKTWVPTETHTDKAPPITCRKCGATRTPWQLVAAVGIDDAYLPAEVIAEQLKLTPPTIRRWAAEGDVSRVGGRYRYGDVRNLAIKRAATRRAIS